MDTKHFDTYVRALTTAASRRRLLAALTGGLLVPGLLGLGTDETGAKRNSQRRRKRKRQAKRKKRKGGNQQSPPPPSAAPVTRVDATCAAGGLGVFLLAEENSRLAQTFTALASGPLVRADLKMAKPAGVGSDFVLRLSPVRDSGEVIVPTNDVLAETAVAEASMPVGGSTVTFAFATPFSVVAGTTYALVLSRPGGGKFVWVGSETNPCPGGGFIGPDQTGSFLDTATDFFFTTFVTS
jgi:hypothetical protein